MSELKVMVYEPDHSGHRLHYVRVIVDALTILGISPTVILSQDAQSSPEYQTHLLPIAKNARFEFFAQCLRGVTFKHALVRAKAFVNCLTDFAPDHVYVPYGDGLSQGLVATPRSKAAMKTRRECETIIMRGTFAYPQRSRARRYVSHLSLRLMLAAPWTQLHFLDQFAYEALPGRHRNSGKISLIPEPVEEIPELDKSTARAELGIPTDGRYIVAAGVIDRRKGVDLLLNAFASSASDRMDRLLLIGGHEPSIRDELASTYSNLVKAGRIISIDNYVTDLHIHRAIRAANVVAVPYPRHVGSSAVLIRAAKAGVPVLSSDWGWVGEITKKYALGAYCNVENNQEFSIALRKSLDSSSSYVVGTCASNFLDFHSIASQASALTRRIRKRLGIGDPWLSHKPF